MREREREGRRRRGGEASGTKGRGGEEVGGRRRRIIYKIRGTAI